VSQSTKETYFPSGETAPPQKLTLDRPEHFQGEFVARFSTYAAFLPDASHGQDSRGHDQRYEGGGHRHELPGSPGLLFQPSQPGYQPEGVLEDAQETHPGLGRLG
jgi:hypothetical protein